MMTTQWLTSFDLHLVHWEVQQKLMNYQLKARCPSLGSLKACSKNIHQSNTPFNSMLLSRTPFLQARRLSLLLNIPKGTRTLSSNEFHIRFSKFGSTTLRSWKTVLSPRPQPLLLLLLPDSLFLCCGELGVSYQRTWRNRNPILPPATSTYCFY